MDRLEQAVAGLEQALGNPTPFPQSWRLLVRTRLRALHAVLSADGSSYDDGWLAARAGHLRRERDQLARRLAGALAALAEAREPDPVRLTLQRLARDVRHHQQRLHDLAYDGVFAEVGGSE